MPREHAMNASRLTALVSTLLIAALLVQGQETAKPLSPDTVKEVRDKLKTERTDLETKGLNKLFSPEFLTRADGFTKTGDTALAANRLFEALDSYRKARQELPGLPADFP